MTRRQRAAKVVHGQHAKRRGYTKCGLMGGRLPDGNHTIVGTNAMSKVTCADCRRNNKPGIC